jgi:tetratricopeptide (TPR) repeat protein
MVEAYEDLVAAIQAGAADALSRLKAVLAARRDQRGEHARWGRLCETAGETGLALTEYQLALRDDPDDVTALARLATLYDEHGATDKAVACAEGWVRAAPGDREAAERLLELLVGSERFERAREVLAAAAETLGRESRDGWGARLRAAGKAEADEDESVPVGMPTDADAVRFLHLFAGRENVYARQWSAEGGESGYTPVREPLTPTAVRNHLIGNVTLGVYPIRLDDTVTFFAFDVDIRKAALARARSSLAEARRIKDAVAADSERLRAALESLGIPALLEDSGYKGRHLWVFLDTPEDAAVVRQFGGLFLKATPPASPDLQVEFFPKQAATGTGIGNLIKLPIGIHRRTGRRSRLLLPDGTPAPDPYGLLRQQARVAREVFYAAIAALKARVIPGEAPGALLSGACPELAEGPVEDGEPVPPEAALVRQVFPAPAPAWTAADFQTNPEIAHLLDRCAVLRALKAKVDEHRRLTHDEQVVLAHSLGHSGAGVLAVNYLLDACVDVPPTARLQSPLAGNPVSCPKIRKRIPQITGAVACNCRFDVAAGQYPNPRLHLATLPEAPPSHATDSPQGLSKGPLPTAPPAWDPADRARALRVLRIKRQELEAEINQVEADLQAYMEAGGQSEIATSDGTLRLVQEPGAPAALVWVEEPCS